MKKLLLVALTTLCCIGFSFGQTADTTQTMLHPDNNTIYEDENGKQTDAVHFMTLMAGGGYSFTPAIENGRVKSLRLKKTDSKIALGTAAPDFNITDLKGTVYSLKALKGKTVVLNFWFTQCAGCIKEMPELNGLVKKYEHDPNVVFLAVTYDSKAKAQAFLAKNPFGYHIVADQLAMTQQYGVSAYPTSIVIDAAGQVVYAESAFTGSEAQKLDQVIAACRQHKQ